MKIGMQTWGSSGDINPFIALACGLSAAGHDVTLVVTGIERKDYSGMAAHNGFRVIKAGAIGKDDNDIIKLGSMIHDARNPLTQTDVVLKHMFEPGVEVMTEAARSLCAENDALIGHFIVHPLHTAAEKARKPHLTLTLNHSAIPTLYAPPLGLPSLGAWANSLFWKIAVKVLEGRILPPINQLREREGLPPVKTFRTVWESPISNLIAVSPELCPNRPDWTPNQHVCGFLNIPDEAFEEDLEDGLKDFLKKGPSPVYMTFGSMVSALKDRAYVIETTRLLVEAARFAGCRAIVQSRWDDVRGVPEYEEIYRLNEVRHTRVFPQCSAVVHHGGAGTTHTACLCGCPSVVVAHIVDQFFWGRELKRLGLAPAILDRRKVTAKAMGGRIRRVLASPDMARRAARVGTAMGAENGIATAVATIERVLSVNR